MSTTMFFALQCCQCSTMQVKQRKKSSSKWMCVVCNQKQSMRKVFAQGPMAKDLRGFVQSFNMSRGFADENQDLVPVLNYDIELENDDHNRQGVGDRKKRRTDWTEYLDPDDHCENPAAQAGQGDEVEPKVVTELPDEMFKRPKLRNYGSGSDRGEGGDQAYKPVFPKRNVRKNVITQGEKLVEYQQTGKKNEGRRATKWDSYISEIGKEAETFEPKAARRASKWNDYITKDDEYMQFGSGRIAADAMNEWEEAILESEANSERVEDDIHPDFL